MELTLKYFHDFGDKKEKLGEDLNTLNAWDTLRTEEGAKGRFFIPTDRAAWERDAESDRRLNDRAKAVIALADPSVESLYSFGVGAAHLEYWIKKLRPELRIRCSDFAPQGVERLRSVFREADEVFQFDMLNGHWDAIDPKSLVLLYRVDTVFNDEGWRTVLRNMSQAGIRNILFIPSDILSVRKVVYFQLKYFIFWILGRKMLFSGFLRTRQRLASLLGEHYEITGVKKIVDLTGFQLNLKSESK